MMASVAGRYASALFDLAKDEHRLVEIEQDIIALQGMFSDSADFRQLVLNPVFSAAEQGNAVSAIAVRAGFHPLTLNFVKLLAQSRRLFVLADITKTFRSLAARHRGEVTAEVSSAHPLTPDQLAQLEDTLKSTAGGKKIQIRTHVDPALLGGLVVKTGSRMIDSSLRTKLESLKIAMKEVR